MKPSKFIVLFVSLIGFAFIAGIQAKAQSVYGYSEIDYDASTNTVTAYAETDVDYELEGSYKGRVVLNTYDQNNNMLYLDIATDNNYTGYVSVTRQFTATAGATYTEVGRHELVLQYHYTDPDSGLLIWDDDWDFEQFTEWGVYTPTWYAFASPSYGDYTYSSQVIEVGDTFDSASIVTGTPDHVKVVSDNIGYPASCPTTGVYVRQLKVQVVDQSGNSLSMAPDGSNINVGESFQNRSTNSCGNGDAVPTSSFTTSAGQYTDVMTVSKNVCGSGISQSSGCGYTLTSTWSWLGASPAKPIWTYSGETRSNVVKVNGQSAVYKPGTELFPAP